MTTRSPTPKALLAQTAPRHSSAAPKANMLQARAHSGAPCATVLQRRKKSPPASPCSSGARRRPSPPARWQLSAASGAALPANGELPDDRSLVGRSQGVLVEQRPRHKEQARRQTVPRGHARKRPSARRGGAVTVARERKRRTKWRLSETLPLCDAWVLPYNYDIHRQNSIPCWRRRLATAALVHGNSSSRVWSTRVFESPPPSPYNRTGHYTCAL